jgi:hypothetical protein
MWSPLPMFHNAFTQPITGTLHFGGTFVSMTHFRSPFSILMRDTCCAPGTASRNRATGYRGQTIRITSRILLACALANCATRNWSFASDPNGLWRNGRRGRDQSNHCQTSRLLHRIMRRSSVVVSTCAISHASSNALTSSLFSCEKSAKASCTL